MPSLDEIRAKYGTGQVSFNNFGIHPEAYQNAPAPTKRRNPRENFLTNSLPTIGGIVGGVGGAIGLGAATGGLGAFGGGVAGSSGGSALGKALENLLEGNSAGEDVGKEALYGGASGLIGGGLGKLGVGALRGAGRAGSSVVGKAVGAPAGGRAGLAERVMGSTLRETPKEARKAAKAGDSLSKGLLERNIKFNDFDEARQIGVNGLKRNEDLLDNLLKTSSETIDLGDLNKATEKLISSYTKAGNTAAVENLSKRIAAIKGAHPQGKLSVAEANAIKRTLYDEVHNSYGTQAAAGTEGIKTLARAFKEGIAEKVPGVNATNKELSFFGRLSDSAFDEIQKGNRKPMMGLTDLMAGGAGMAAFGPAGIMAAGARNAIGSPAVKTRVAQAINTGVAKPNFGALKPGVLPKQVTGKTISQVGVGGAMGRYAGMMPQQDPAQDPLLADSLASEVPDPTAQPMEDELAMKQQEVENVRQQFLQEMEKDLRATGGKNIPELKTMYELYMDGQDSKGKKDSKVDANTKKELAKLSTAENVANQVLRQFTQLGGTGRIAGQGQKLTAALGFNAKARVYEQYREAALANIAKAIGGESGVLTDQDIKRIRGMLPEITDTEQEARMKLDNLFADIEAKKNYYRVNGAGGPDEDDLNSALNSIY